MKFTLTIETDTLEDLNGFLNQPTTSREVDVTVPEEPAPSPSLTDVTLEEPLTTATIDNAGVPWDARIHSASKAMNADGSWRKRRGVDDAMYQAILAELQPVAPPVEPATEITVPEPSADFTGEDIMKIIGSAVQSGTITVTYIPDLCAECGLAQLTDILEDNDALVKVIGKLRQDEVLK